MRRSNKSLLLGKSHDRTKIANAIWGRGRIKKESGSQGWNGALESAMALRPSYPEGIGDKESVEAWPGNLPVGEIWRRIGPG